MKENAVLEIADLALTRNGRPLLAGIDLELAAGELRLLVGESGAGKTTLLRLIAGFEIPDAGRIAIGGRQVSAAGAILAPPHERGLGMSFQDGALWPHLSVEQHLRFGLDRRIAKRSEQDARIEELLELAGLSDRRRERPGHLSGGERQLLGLARSLVQEPKLLLLDEPLAHVDLRAQRRVASTLLRHLEAHSITALWVTHRPEEVALVGARVAVLSSGRVERELAASEFDTWLEGA